MSGHQVPYHLRTNKFIERQLFLDALDFVRVYNGPSKYIYISMGGPFLEDFKHINDRFAIESMVSLESDEQTWKRQIFNSPYGFINCRNESSGEFISNFDDFALEHEDKRFVIWLDYAAADSRFKQLQEFEELITKLSEGDVIKITLNANYQSPKKRSEVQGISDRQYDTILISEHTDQLSDYLPLSGVEKRHLNESGFAKLLAQSVRIAATKGTENLQVEAVPLMGIRYNDGEHQMLTVTAMICSNELVAMIEGDQGFQNWPLKSKDWDTVYEVRVPHLSTKERLTINSLMKDMSDANSIQTKLGFQFDDNFGRSMELLTSYMKYYRNYPSFARMQ